MTQKELDQGFRQMRVRLHGNLARIEVPAEDIKKIAEKKMRSRINEEFRRLGFAYFTLDLAGFRSGSMNETL